MPRGDGTPDRDWRERTAPAAASDCPEVIWMALSLLAGPRLAVRCLTPAPDGTTPACLTWGQLWARAGAEGLPCPDACGRRALQRRAQDLVRWADQRAIDLIAWNSPRYPRLLRRLPQPPALLWVKGTADLNAPAVAIVGARSASRAALTLARELGRDLAAAGLTVVSGLALGADGAAHDGAQTAGQTIAVLGTGIDVCYPRQHRCLARRIAATGALVTEFVPETPPLPHHFPMRNRIVAGLSLAVLVVEASETSGALITAHAALEQGKDVMVAPGLALAGRNRGGHALIKDGAALVENCRDVLDVLRAGPLRAWSPPGPPDAFGPRPAGVLPPGAAESDAGRLLSGWGRGEELFLDEIVELSGIRPERLLPALLECELAGTIGRVPGGRFVRL
jgi:DNA processing protein